MQWSPRRNSNLPSGISQQDSLPRIQAAIRTAHSERHSKGIHGRQTSMREDGAEQYININSMFTMMLSDGMKYIRKAGTEILAGASL